MTDVPLCLLREVPHFLNGPAFFLFLGAEPYQQALSQRRAEGVHNENLPFREFLGKLPGGNHGGLISSGQRGGKAEAEHVISGGKNRLHGFFELAHVDGRGHRTAPRPDPGVKIRKRNLPAVQLVPEALPVQLQTQGQHRKAQLRRGLRFQVAAAIRHNNIHQPRSFPLRAALLSWAFRLALISWPLCFRSMATQ